MPFLSWIDDKQLISIVSDLLIKASEAQKNATAKFGKNVIDPFSALFEMSGFEIDLNTWMKNETTRQAQKTLQNHVGDFHQNILGLCTGWENKKTGNVIDLVSNNSKIIAEIKNKYNTISGGKLSDLYYSLENLVMPKTSIYKDYTAYYVSIIPKKPIKFNKEFIPSDKEKGEKCTINTKIREIDGASFYHLVTGEPNALNQLFNILPQIISLNSEYRYKQNELNQLDCFFKQAFG
jgi:hypothetical protein